MSGHKTEDQAKDEYIQRMGEPLGAQFNALWQELAWLHVKWAGYVELFATSAERVHLLNQAAPNFFGIMQGVLWEDVMVHAARLTDPPKSVGKENLTVAALPGLVPPEIGGSIETLCAEAKSRTTFCRDWRNRRIAHNDRALALNPKDAKPLEAASRQKLREALRAIGDVLNAVSDHYGCSPTSFEHTIPALGGAGLLLDVLEAGLQARKG